MTDKLKRLIGRIKTRVFYNRCYSRMEGLAIAAFGMCSGAYVDKYRTEKCLNCPYFRNLKEDEERFVADNDR